MNAVEIEEAVSQLVAEPFDPAEFPYQFITAFGAKKTTVDRLRKGDSNQSDVGGVLQRNNIHIAVAPPGGVHDVLAALRASPKTASIKAKFLFATDGETVEAEDLVGGDVIACAYADLPRYFATFLPLAGISTVKEIKNNPVDIKATGRLNRLYVTLLNDNPEWATEERRHALNQFMARLIFCYFAEDTGIFNGEGLFTAAVARMSEAGHGSGEAQWGNTHEVLQHLFLAMETPVKHEGNFDDRYRRAAGIRPYADVFPYVNGGLFTAAGECPRFSRTARAYLLSAGELDWKEINPDIFGSMIQAVADDGERGELGMHYTSVPNILKVLNPLFLDDLREQLEAAGHSKQKLRNLRKRLANIRVFDPACGSGNFLVIAYKRMREIEATIVERLGGEASLRLDERRSVIPLSNFYGIEIKGFAAEIARLALLIAEFQADCLYLSQQEARAMVLPLHKTGQITVGNALRLDWLEVCPAVRRADNSERVLAGPTGRPALEENGLESGAEPETYICGNPPYYGGKLQTLQQKEDLEAVFTARSEKWASLDYVAGWFLKASDYLGRTGNAGALVSTNSICQGQQVPILWPLILQMGISIAFAHTSFRWSNLASGKAVVTVVIVGLTQQRRKQAVRLYETTDDNETVVRRADNINPYLISGPDIIVQPVSKPENGLHEMMFGNMPRDNGHLLLSPEEMAALATSHPSARPFLKRFQGSEDFIEGKYRGCIWIREKDQEEASRIAPLARRMEAVASARRGMKAASTKKFADKPYRFVQIQGVASRQSIIIPRHSSEARPYLPVGLVDVDVIVADSALAIYDAPLWNLAIIASRLHLVWISAVCGKIKTDFRYSNTLGWNTFPVPDITQQDKIDLIGSAERIILVREAHFPASVADLYDPSTMPKDLYTAHEENDNILERAYLGRRFRNDTERLEILFKLYDQRTKHSSALLSCGLSPMLKL
ncbi:class I SAM-dependent DNA methyltransferase [Sphingomonas sp. BAUL-RG-20F-R05-02]|uniref:class I SAM-dependent DNA methyltransferase n=1 Tax=Sphingomonas sp. BAUL-RG-20F-R05-02 TaxID=2914830 RepID=UPI001F5A30A5|nr:DNA methyltransferase [Sphingomonas sp. BAUL-RG-20F-R05-02]